jgi:hypothetical protein
MVTLGESLGARRTRSLTGAVRRRLYAEEGRRYAVSEIGFRA